MSTRAELLEQCLVRGLRATGWRKERMQAALAELASPPAEPKSDTVVAPAAESSRSQGLAAKLAARTGPCGAIGSCQCDAWEPAGRDSHGWAYCQCSHSQWSHAESPGK